MKVHSTQASLLIAVLMMTSFVAIAAQARGGVINEDFKLLADDGTHGDLFGYSIAIDDGVVAVGALSHGHNGHCSGSAYLFNASTGAQVAELLPADGGPDDHFGRSIAIANGVVAVGASADNDNGEDSGSAYLFNASTGAQIAKLLPSDGASDDRFGRSIAIANGVVAVGAHQDDDNGGRSGSAYLLDASSGAQIAKLLPSDGENLDRFGYSIAIDNGLVAVGAWGDDDNGEESGSAYIFDASTGVQIAKLLPSDGAEVDLFGQSIAIDVDVVAVGAFRDDDNGTDSGSAYLFNAFTGAQIAKLLPSDGAAFDHFGQSIAIDNGVVVVGATWDQDNGDRSGSAYLFNGFTGAQIAKLLPSDGSRRDEFGRSIAIDNGVIAVGAFRDYDNGVDSGSAYVFDVSDGESCTRDPEWICDGDVDGDLQVNPVDSGLVQAAFGSTDEVDLCQYDVDCDGQINPVDSGIVQSLFGTCEEPPDACP